jgi:hypothetical protein
MPKEFYVKPEVKSETMAPEAFGGGGSGMAGGGQNYGWFWNWSWWWK